MNQALIIDFIDYQKQTTSENHSLDELSTAILSLIQRLRDHEPIMDID